MNFDKSWELEYSKGNALNKYPFDFVVSLTFNYFGKVKDKSKVKILDVGCGAGNNSMFFAQEGFNVFGIDGSPTVIKHVKEKFKKKNLKGKFEQMYNHKILPLIGNDNNDNGIAEYIIVLKSTF